MKRTDEEWLKDLEEYLDHLAAIDKGYTKKQHDEAKNSIMTSLKKHVKTPPVYRELWRGYYTCGACGRWLRRERERQYKYCPDCGTRLDWGLGK